MAAKKSSNTEPDAADLVPSQEEGQKALGQDVGYIGDKVDPIANEEYSQETDPTSSPGILDAQQARLDALAAEQDNT